MVSGSDTGSGVDAGTRFQQGSFTQIPTPKTWSNGDDLYPGTLNKEWRDTFLWLLRKTSPAFSGYNADGAALSLTANVAIPIKTEELKRGNVAHATNDTKVYVYETGVYLVLAQVGASLSGVTGTNFSSVIKKNGVVESAGDISRTGGVIGVQHMTSLSLTAGDYLEVALGGSWTGTPTGGTTTAVYPWLWLWWRNK